MSLTTALLGARGQAMASQLGWLAATLEAAAQSADLNKKAVIWTGAAAILGAITTVAGLFSSS